MLAGDERAHQCIREIAFGKLATFKVSHPHLSVMKTPEPEPKDDAPPWGRYWRCSWCSHAASAALGSGPGAVHGRPAVARDRQR
jgi:hypothetical protein